MKFDESHPLNEKVVRHMGWPGVPAIVSPDSHPDPTTQLGSHPDAVERVWVNLNGSLPVDCRAIVYGSPALVDPGCGVVLAMSYGTAYALRVPTQQIDAALAVGCELERTWSTGDKTNIEETMGHGWVFGAWVDEELRWLLDVYDELQGTA